MNNFKNISTIIFDFGDVIVNLNLALCIQKFKDLGLTDIEKYLSNFGQKEIFLKFENGEINTTEFLNEIRNLTDLPLSDLEIQDAWCAFLADIPQQRIELLEKLKPRFRLLLLSNTNPLHIEVNAMKEFARYGKTMYDYFDKCYLSYEMKLTKPNADIFQALLADAQLNPEECLFLDDGLKNIEAASQIGIQTYLVTPNDDLSFLLKI